MGALSEHMQEKSSRLSYFIVKEMFMPYSEIGGASSDLGWLWQVVGQLVLLNKERKNMR